MKADREAIRSRQNSRVRALHALTTRRGRKRRGEVLLVGEKIVRDALDGGVPLRELYVREADAEAILAALPGAGGAPLAPFVATLSGRLFEGLGFDSAPRCLAVAATPEGDLAAVAGPPGSPGAVGLFCGIQDPGNLGTMLRSAWFFGLRGAALTAGTADPYSPKVLRAAIGSVLRRPPVVFGGLEGATKAFAGLGYRPVVLAAHGGAPLAEAAWPRRSLLMVGSEGKGFEGVALPSDALVLTIEGGAAESLNAAVAFSVAAWAWSRQRACGADSLES